MQIALEVSVRLWKAVHLHYCLFIYLFIYGVFNDFANKSDYITSNDKMISK
jgi:hypothetical protein